MVAIPILGWTYNRVASEAVKERFTATDSSSYKHSTGARLRDLKEPFVKGLKKPQIYLIGHGPAKAILPGSEHSDIGWMTLHFGLGGLFCYLMLLYRPFRYSLQKCHSRNILPLNKVFFIFSAEVIIVWFIYIQAESVFKLQQLMSINMFTIGLVFASINYTDDKIDQEDNQTLAIEH
jgi:hypothetical protein